MCSRCKGQSLASLEKKEKAKRKQRDCLLSVCHFVSGRETGVTVIDVAQKSPTDCILPPSSLFFPFRTAFDTYFLLDSSLGNNQHLAITPCTPSTHSLLPTIDIWSLERHPIHIHTLVPHTIGLLTSTFPASQRQRDAYTFWRRIFQTFHTRHTHHTHLTKQPPTPIRTHLHLHHH